MAIHFLASRGRVWLPRFAAQEHTQWFLQGERVPSLDDTLETIWSQLGRGAADGHHGFHWPVICSIADGVAQGRVVVLRGIDRPRRRLWFHTDRRSAKLDQLVGMSWTFYDARARLQLRLHGTSALADEATTDREWATLPVTSRRTYLVQPAPGTVLGEEWSSSFAHGGRLPTREESEAGRTSFAVVSTRVDVVESLRLLREGHERARFTWSDEAWHATWLAP